MNFLEIAVDGIGGNAANTVPMYKKPSISIEFAPDGQRARKVISRSNAKATGKFPSWKMGRMMHYESSPERNAFRLLDVCPEVRSYREQPCAVHYEMDGEKHIHYPDILVTLPASKILAEVKTAADAATPDVARRTAFMEQALPLLGFEYLIVKAEHLAKAPRLDIAKKLLRHGRSPVPMVQREQIRQLFKANGSVCWGMFKLGTAGGKYYSHICRLILEGTVTINFNLPLVDESPIYASTNFSGGASWE